MKKITKTIARNKFFNGCSIILVASKLRPEFGCCININNELDFDSAVNAYRYYNCNNECGNTVSYYLP